MTLRTLLSGLACIGFVACAGAQSDLGEAPSATLADVQASPDSWRVAEPENLVLIDTSVGEIIVELLPEVAPTHVAQFRNYVQAGLYDSTVFHRVIKGFMAQGGDVETTHGREALLGQMQSEFTFRSDPKTFSIDPIGPADSASNGFYKGFPIQSVAQFMAEMSFDGKVETWMPHCEGVLSTARTGDPNSADAQFFMISDDGRHLDRAYTAKGRVLVGLDVVKAIKLGPVPDGAPISNPDVLRSAVLFADIPEADRPTVYVQRTNTPEWAALLQAADNAGADICDLPAVPVVVE